MFNRGDGLSYKLILLCQPLPFTIDKKRAASLQCK